MTPLAPQVVRIEVPAANARIIAGLLPFLSEAKVARGEEAGALADLRRDGSRYTARLVDEVAARAAFTEPGAYRVLALHQHVTGGAPSDSERRLRAGALGDLDAASIPAGLDYVAVGHLHRPQVILGAPSPALYAGSPIAYSFSEADQIKRAVLVDLAPGRAAKITSVPLGSGRPLEIWTVTSIDAARDRAARADAEGRSPIVEVRADLGRRLERADGDALFQLGRLVASPFLPGLTVVAVRDLHDPSRRDATSSADALPPELSAQDLFRELWEKKHGSAPDDETVAELSAALLDVTESETARGRASSDGEARPRGAR